MDHPFSNEMNLLYLDLYPGLFQDSIQQTEPAEKEKATILKNANITSVTATIAHELQHLIHSQTLPTSESALFVNEGFSELAEILTGHPPRDATAYFQESHRPLFSWSSQHPLPDYARASLFMHYLYENIGDDFLHTMISKGWNGANGLWNAVKLTSNSRLDDLFVRWGRDLLKGPQGNSTPVHQMAHSYAGMHETDVEAGAYRHPARMHLRFPARGNEWVFPGAASMHRTSWSHQWMSFPFTYGIEIMAEDESLTGDWTAVAEAPDQREMRHTYYVGDEVRTVPDRAHPHQTIYMLRSTTDDLQGTGEGTGYGTGAGTPQGSWSDPETGGLMDTFLVEGTKTALREWQKYGDGKPQIFLDNASFLLVPDGTRMGFEFVQSESAWLRGTRIKLIHLNEVTGSGIPAEAERNVMVSVETYKDGAWQVLIPVFRHKVQRQNGYLSYEYIRWPHEYDMMKELSGRFRIVLEPDGASSNLFAIGMQRSHTEYSYIYRDDSWTNLQETYPETFFTTWGGIVDAEWVIPVETEEVMSDIYSKMTVHDDVVTLDLKMPEHADQNRSSLVARLPDGRYVQGRWIAETEAASNSGISATDGDNSSDPLLLRAEFPLQTGADYMFQGVITGADSGRRYRIEHQEKIHEERLLQVTGNYPNPFNPSTNVEFTLLEPGEFRWRVFDLLGRQVIAGSPAFYEAGKHQKLLDLSGFATGIYFVRAETQRSRDGFFAASTHKILMVR